MRCLQCGKELALFKKLTEGEFCSPEHSTHYYDAQQQLIIERLRTSALRLRAGMVAANRGVAASSQPPVENLPPSAQFLFAGPSLPESQPEMLRIPTMEGDARTLAAPDSDKR